MHSIPGGRGGGCIPYNYMTVKYGYSFVHESCILGHSYLIQWFSIQSRALFEESGGRSNKKIRRYCYFIF